ncbi:MAG: hypothetical protein P4L77_07115 [Sulfuriferula sp.]|nr:hypothetical protein [Sulfuriferula sp.]
MKTINRLSFGYIHRYSLLCLLALISADIFAATLPAAPQNIALTNGTEIPVTIFPAASNTILLWLPSENGLVPAEFNTAAALAKSGIEVWLADLHGAYFLPLVPSSMQQIPSSDVAQLIGAVARRSGKTVYLITEGNGAALALTGAAAVHDNTHALGGAILLSPNLYVATPEPGEDAQYLPIATATRLPVAILQPELSPWRWHIDELQSLLKQGGATVTVNLLPGIRDRFYFRDDALPAELALTPTLPQLIINAYKQLGGNRP